MQSNASCGNGNYFLLINMSCSRYSVHIHLSIEDEAGRFWLSLSGTPQSLLPSFPPSSASPLLLCGLTQRLLVFSSGSVCAAGPGQLALRPGRPALRGPDPADQWAELRRLEHRQGPQGPEGCSRDSYRAGGPRQVRGFRSHVEVLGERCCKIEGLHDAMDCVVEFRSWLQNMACTSFIFIVCVCVCAGRSSAPSPCTRTAPATWASSTSLAKSPRWSKMAPPPATAC